MSKILLEIIIFTIVDKATEMRKVRVPRILLYKRPLSAPNQLVDTWASKWRVYPREVHWVPCAPLEPQ